MLEKGAMPGSILVISSRLALNDENMALELLEIKFGAEKHQQLCICPWRVGLSFMVVVVYYKPRVSWFFLP